MQSLNHDDALREQQRSRQPQPLPMKHLGNVSSNARRQEAAKSLVQVLREHWPGVCVIQEIADRDLEPLNDKPSHRLREFSHTLDKRICGD
jgi:hypothetical protein